MKVLQKLLMVAVVMASVAFYAHSAEATSINYANLANTSPGEGGYSLFSQTVDGITVNASATNLDGSVSYNAYLDSTWNGGGGLGGLGVCKELTGGTGSDCTPSSDDNLTAGERLNLSFSQEVTITEILFRDGEHYTTFTYADNDFDLFINGSFDSSYGLTHFFNTPLTGTDFGFVSSLGGNDVDEIYIEKITFTASVPEPSTLILLGSGLISLGFIRRRFKK
jgi:hypothetical protein